MSNLEIYLNQDLVKIFTSTNAHVVDFTLFDTIDALPHLGITLNIGPYSLVNSFYCFSGDCLSMLKRINC